MKNEMFRFNSAGGRKEHVLKINQNIAKPAAVHLRALSIIDFALSTVPTQEFTMLVWLHSINPLQSLTAILGNGSSWGLMESSQVCLHFNLIQLVKEIVGLRTSHAILQNIVTISQSINPEYKSWYYLGDHIYKMDYDDMLQAHKDNNVQA